MKTTASLSIYDNLFRLRRRFVPRCRTRTALLDVSSWVNLALLLLMFFIANASFVLQPGIAVNLPAAPMTGGAGAGSLVLTVTQEKLMFFNDERITLDGLPAALNKAIHFEPGATLVLEADERVSHGDLIRIYDIATEAGFKNIVLATRILSPRPAARE